jgi:hypothetical protein
LFESIDVALLSMQLDETRQHRDVALRCLSGLPAPFARASPAASGSQTGAAKKPLLICKK